MTTNTHKMTTNTHEMTTNTHKIPKEDVAVPLVCALTRNLSTGRCSIDLEGVFNTENPKSRCSTTFYRILYLCFFFRNEKKTLSHGTAYS